MAPAQKKTIKKRLSKVKQIAMKKSTSPVKPSAAKRVKSNHPTYAVMITNAIRAMNEHNGSSRQGILKYIIKTYNLDEKLAKMRSKLALRAALQSGQLKYGKTTGSFKVGDKVKSDDKTAKTKPKKNVVKKKEVKKVVPAAAPVVVKRKAPKSEEVKKVPVVAAKSVAKKIVKKKASAAVSTSTRDTRLRKVAC
jgi:histone H1/5